MGRPFLLLLILAATCLGYDDSRLGQSRSLPNLTPAPSLRPPTLGKYRHPPYSPLAPITSGATTVFRNPYEVTGSREMGDAHRTQDRDPTGSRHYKNEAYSSLLNSHLLSSIVSAMLGHQDRGPRFEEASGAARLAYRGPQPHDNLYQNLVPYHYDGAQIPNCALANRHLYNLSQCLQDSSYPVTTIRHELERNRPLVDKLLSDISFQSADNLVDGLTKAEEEAEGGSGEGSYVCPSDVFYSRPKRAVNTYGKWKVVVNLPEEYYAQGHGVGYEAYTQTVRLEQCHHPKLPCNYLDPHLTSSCLQKHNFVRLLAYTYEEGLHIDSFKLPVACSCRVSSSSRNYYPGPPPPPLLQSTTVPPAILLPQLLPSRPPLHHRPTPHHPHPPLLLPTPQPLQHSPSPKPYAVLLGK